MGRWFAPRCAEPIGSNTAPPQLNRLVVWPCVGKSRSKGAKTGGAALFSRGREVLATRLALPGWIPRRDPDVEQGKAPAEFPRLLFGIPYSVLDETGSCL